MHLENWIMLMIGGSLASDIIIFTFLIRSQTLYPVELRAHAHGLYYGTEGVLSTAIAEKKPEICPQTAWMHAINISYINSTSDSSLGRHLFRKGLLK
jgi:hypothetical protein